MSLPFSNPKTRIDMADLESGKASADVTVTSVTPVSERPLIGRRRTSDKQAGAKFENTALDSLDEDDALTRLGDFMTKLYNGSILTRYTLYILPVAIVLAIPLILFATVYKSGKKLELGVFVWAEILWIGLWGCKLGAKVVPWIFQAACGLISSGVRKYTSVLKALEIPISLFFWTILAYATVPVICRVDSNACHSGWLDGIQKGFKAAIIVATIFLVEKTFMQVISINYHRKQFSHKIKESKRLIRRLDLLYDASRTLFPEFGREFLQEDEEIQGASLGDVRETLLKAGMRSQVLNDAGRIRDKATAAIGAMVSDVTGKEIMNATAAHTVVVEALETERASKALARRIWLSFVSEGNSALYKTDLIEVLGESMTAEVEEIFDVLDQDANGDVSLDEMTAIIVNAGKARKNRAASMHDISQAIAVLDRILMVIVLGAIAFIYASFFSPTFANRNFSIWTSFTGLSFAIGGTVTEFFTCVFFLLIKHPLDVGDTVTINGIDMVCTRISLMYSVYRRLDSGKTVQLPHTLSNSLWIENMSRSKEMKERIVLSVAADTSNEDILALREEMQKFVTAEENRRDFHPIFDIELLSVGNMQHLDLQVEIKHKSNWSNDLLRSTRRNKFMCALLASMRRVPIAPPGGSGAPLGDPANPSYSVSVSDPEAAASRAEHKAAANAKRLFPAGGSSLAAIPEGVSSAFQNPAKAMIASISGRRASEAMQGGRRSGESLRIATVPRSTSIHGPVTFVSSPLR